MRGEESGTMVDDKKPAGRGGMTGSGSPSERQSSPSPVEAIAAELERMAQRATYSDHVQSPIVDTIARAPSARPFVGALRVLVGRLTADRQVAPQQSIVLRLLRDCDLEVAVKLDLLREFLVCEHRMQWGHMDPEQLARKLGDERNTVVAAVFDTVREGKWASLGTLLDWLDDRRRLGESKVSVDSIAQSLLVVLARVHPGSVLDAASAHNTMPALGLIPVIAALHPDDGMAFARRSATEPGSAFSAAMALSGLVAVESLHEGVRDVAIAIASNPAAGHARPQALSVLLALPTIAPAVWPLVAALQAPYLHQIPLRLAQRVRDDLLEPLEVLEQWMRDLPVDAFIGDEACYALAECFALARPSEVDRVPLSHELQKRLLEDVAEAWRRGVSGATVARVVESALYERSDAECSSLGLDDLALALVATDARCRKLLMYVVTTPSSRGAAWSVRILERIAELADVDEKKEYAETLLLDAGARRDRWSQAAVKRLLAAGAA